MVMNMSRRNETFRYEFGEPLAGKFRLTEIDGNKLESRMGEMEVQDISLQGMKVTMPLDLPVREKAINGLFYVTIASADYTIPGKFIWRKPKVNEYQYGIHLQCDNAMKNALLSGLKSHAKSNLTEKSDS